MNDILASCDLHYAMEVAQTLSSLGDNPDIGNRSSGSAAEQQAADYIKAQMTEIGLANVTEDEFTADTWSFNKGRLYAQNADGTQRTVLLGGFATNLVYNGEAQLVDAGKGTAAEYEGLDVKGKAVLIEIDQLNQWWINYPAYEAYLNGALCVIVCNTSGYATYDNETIGSMDICGIAEAAAVSIGIEDYRALKARIAADGGETTVRLDVDSVVAKDGSSQNVWGEIPGSGGGVIYFFAHMDGYYHSYFDDASGMGSMLSIAKAVIDSGYTPEKTLRFVAHGAEEWGESGAAYDEAVGWLTGVDCNACAVFASEGAFEYLSGIVYNQSEGTWGEGLLAYPGENLWSVIATLQSADENTDVSGVLETLKAALDRQMGNMDEIDAQLTADAAAATALLTELAA